MSADDRKGERTVNVTDRPVEVQGMVQTVLTFLLLGVMSWVGLTLEEVKDNTADNNKAIAVFAVHLENQRDELRRHIDNPRAHSK